MTLLLPALFSPTITANGLQSSIVVLRLRYPVARNALMYMVHSLATNPSCEVLGRNREDMLGAGESAISGAPRRPDPEVGCKCGRKRRIDDPGRRKTARGTSK